VAWVFDSLAARVVTIFSAGLLALLFAIAFVAIWPDRRPAAFRLPSAKETADMARALEAAPLALQPLILQALSRNGLIVRLASKVSNAGEVDDSLRDAPGLERLFAPRYGAELEGRRFRIQRREGALLQALGSEDATREGAIRMTVHLSTGQELVLERTPVLLQRLFNRFLIVAAAVVLVLLFVLILCMRQIAQPVRRLAEGVRQLAKNVSAPDLPLQGPRELKDLAASYNEMKGRIRELLDERTRTLAAIAHDVRTYLTRLRLRAEFIDDPDQRSRAVTDLEEMTRLLDDTLMFARNAAAKSGCRFETADVRTEIAEFAALREEVGDPVWFDAAMGDRLLAHCSPLTLRRILANLTDNAVRYGGGAQLSAKKEGDQISIAIEDDGPGVPPDSIERLTAPFERIEPSRGRRTGGAGLGLAIVKALAESQGGTITIENRREGGLRVQVCFRAAVETPVANYAI
jgi:two-component system osmolarity sensor histidine kinase EnvZ